MMSVEGKVDVRCSIEDAWDLFCRFGDVAKLIPTVEDVQVDGDTVHARVETKLGVLPISSRIYLEVTERKPLCCLKARGLSYLGETLTEQMKKNIEGVDADSAGHMLLHLDLRPSDEEGCIVVTYEAQIEAEGRLKRIYEAILRTKVPKLMEEFADNIRGALEKDVQPAEAPQEQAKDAAAEPAPESSPPLTPEPLAAPAPAPASTPPPASAGSRALARPAPEGLWARFMGWLRGCFRRLLGGTT